MEENLETMLKRDDLEEVLENIKENLITLIKEQEKKYE